MRGEPRFVLTAGDPQKKGYLSLPAAGAELAPVVQQVGASRQCAVCLIRLLSCCTQGVGHTMHAG